MKDNSSAPEWSPKQIISIDELVYRASSSFSGECWNFGMYLDSMLYFDFGEKYPIVLRNGLKKFIGSDVLSIRDAYWSFHHLDVNIDSDKIEPIAFGAMKAQIINHSISSVKLNEDKKIIVFSFSSGASINLDVTNIYGTDLTIFEIRNNNNTILCLNFDKTAWCY